ncbi:ABC-2 family transporter protein [Candidatus Dojkabacteria bacterium]|nr:ABC-2 family transporter protein [Candidatus Dojkabacteria bacterium]
MIDTVGKVFRITKVFLGYSLQKAMAYRVNFFFLYLAVLVQSVGEVILLNVVLNQIDSVMGWGVYEILIVMGFAKIIEGIAWMVYRGGLMDFSENIRTGDIDNILLKPLDLQFLISIENFAFEETSGVIAGIVFVVVGVVGSETVLSVENVLGAILALSVGMVFHYVFRLVYSTVAIFTTALERATVLDVKFFELGRYPVQIFPRIVSKFLTYVIPIAFVGTIPAEMIVWGLDLKMVITGLVIEIVLLVGARSFLKWALRKYEGVGK